jgi:peroxisomal 2,4-dienoyl-CoA reductase
MTKTMAVEWGPSKVRVVGIVPGAIEGTEGFERLGDFANANNKEKTNAAFKNAESDAKERRNYLDGSARVQVPLQRFGKVTDIANAALLLGSPITSYVTGVNLVVDGGDTLIYPNSTFKSPAFVEAWADAKL